MGLRLAAVATSFAAWALTAPVVEAQSPYLLFVPPILVASRRRRSRARPARDRVEPRLLPGGDGPAHSPPARNVQRRDLTIIGIGMA